MRDESIGEERKKSNIVGVNWDERRSKWRAKIKISGKNISLGSYSTIEEAAKARRLGEIKYFGNTINNIYTKTSNKNNKSGVVGVHWSTTREAWIAKISFMGKSYTLGEFDNISEAKNIRKLAEQNIINDNFLKWYNERHFTKSDSNYKSNELIGDKFKTFTVVGFDRKDDGYHRYWMCKCDNCGETKSVREDTLLKLKFRKCKCDPNPTPTTQPSTKSRKIVCNTNVGLILENKPKSSSKSGICGVYWNTTRRKWVAQITFRKKRYTLGRFDNIEDAIAIRKKAEENIFGDFLEWYKDEYNADI